MSSLTEEQRKRIEENRKKALEKRALLESALKQKLVPSTANNNNNGVGLSKYTSPFNVNGSSLSGKTANQVPYPSQQTTTTSHSSNYLNKTNDYKGFNSPNKLNENKDESTMKSNYTEVCGCSNETNITSSSFKTNVTLRGQCFLLSRKRFYVDIAYNKEVIDIFKSIPGRMYDIQTKQWNFSIDDHNKLVSLLKPLQPNVLLIPLPRRLVTVFMKADETRQIKEYDLSSMDPVLVQALLPFQKEGLFFGIQHGGRVLIADDMGLGKTIQGIAIANYFKKDWPLLVVTPSSVRYNWLEAFHVWLPSVEPQEISVISSGKDHIPNDKIIIMNYDILSKLKDTIIKRKFNSVIFDESHFLKNYKSARTKAAQAIMKNVKRILMLSGTPALSRPIELFTQLHALCPQSIGSFQEYGIRYCNGQMGTWGWDFSGSSNMAELQLLLEEVVMIRRLKSDVMQQLPSKVRQVIILDPSKVSTKGKVLKAMYQRMQRSDLKGMERRGALLEYFHETGAVKIPAVCEYILDLLESDQKFLCFAHHQGVMNAICDCVQKKKVGYIRIDGSVSGEQRKKLCDQFQLNDSCKVAVLSITSANCGITLTAASLVVFAELFWNPGILTQAEDRAHRIGQEDTVIVQYLVAKNTADDEIWPLVQRKLDTLNKAGLSKDNFNTADTVVRPDPKQMLLDDLWNDLGSPDLLDDIESSDDIPEKRLKLDL